MRTIAAIAALAAVCTGAASLMAVSRHTQPAMSASDEIRALWVQRTSLRSRPTIAAMVETARASGFNTLLVQVRGRGDAYYRSTLEPRGSLLASEPTAFDPLAEVLSVARANGLSVHAWVNVNLVSSAAQLPGDRHHVIYRHPQWLMVPEQLAATMAHLSPRSPSYLGTLARWSRTHLDDLEGLYLSPHQPEAAAHITAVIGELASKYELDGIHLDYLRYPNAEFDYSVEALGAFRASLVAELSPAERRRIDARRATDVTAYALAFPQRWNTFRQSRLTDLLRKIKATVTAARPGLVLSAAVVPESDRAATERLQDWRAWVEERLLDVVCPMAYTPDRAEFAQQIQSAGNARASAEVWAGIGAYRLSPEGTVAHASIARRLGVRGIALFSYDNLIDSSSSQPPDYLAEVGRALFGHAALVGVQ